MLPVDFGTSQTLDWRFRSFVRRLLSRTTYDIALMLNHEAGGREDSPTGDLLDGRTVYTTLAEVRGYDGGKRIIGRKRLVAVDTEGRLLLVSLTFAVVPGSVGGHAILGAIRKRGPWLKHPFVDAGYDRTKLSDRSTLVEFFIDIACRSAKLVIFVSMLPLRNVLYQPRQKTLQ